MHLPLNHRNIRKSRIFELKINLGAALRPIKRLQAHVVGSVGADVSRPAHALESFKLLPRIHEFRPILDLLDDVVPRLYIGLKIEHLGPLRLEAHAHRWVLPLSLLRSNLLQCSIAKMHFYSFIL